MIATIRRADIGWAVDGAHEPHVARTLRDMKSWLISHGYRQVGGSHGFQWIKS